MKYITLAVTLIALGTAAQAQTRNYDVCIARQCGACVRQHGLAARAAGNDARVSRVVAAYQRAGGGGNTPEAASVRRSRDFQSLLAEYRRKCGCPSWC
jgi:AhpD family alkylhydroperoxidase